MGFDISNFDDAIDYVVSMVGSDFEETMKIANDIIENPENYTGPKAAATAQMLAAHRYKIGVAAQYWKGKAAIKDGGTKQDQMIKNALHLGWEAIEEVINTLKITARYDHQLANQSR